MSEGGEARDHEIVTQKRCSQCGEAKPLDEFYRQSGGRHGRHASCKACAEQQRREYRRKNPPQRKDWTGVDRPSHKVCKSCGQDKPLSEYFNATTTRDGKEHDCKACHYEATKARRQANPEQERKRRDRYRKNNPEKVAAKNAVQRAVLAGELVKPPHCERCDEPRVQGHHPDYSKPLEVIWLCQRCHAEEHARLREAA